MVNINLLPEEARKTTTGRRTASFPAWIAPIGLVSVLVLAAAALTLAQLQQIRDLEGEIGMLSREIAKYKQEAALLQDIATRTDALNRRVEAARDLDRTRGVYVQELAALDAVMPSNVWLTGFTEEGGGRLARIEGRSLGPLAVFSLMRGLEASAPFERVTLEYLKKDPDQELGATAFVLSAGSM